MTPKLDTLCIELLKRIPDELTESFTPGEGALPGGYLITNPAIIIDYINRALHQLFNNFWQSSGGAIKDFVRIFPELVKISSSVALTSGNYAIATPHKDFYKIIGGVIVTGNKYIKPKDETLYTVYLTQEYSSAIIPTSNDPVIIQVHDMLAVFPQNLSGQIKFHYVRRPVDPTTGNALIQDGDYDSPFYEHWNNAIVDLAYLMYLHETNETT